MELNRAKSNNEVTSASVIAVTEDDMSNSLLLEKEKELLSSVRKTDISTQAEASLEPECISKSNADTGIISSLSPSISLFSSGSSSTAPFVTPTSNASVTINENNNVDTSNLNYMPSASDEFKSLQKNIKGKEDINLITTKETSLNNNAMSDNTSDISSNKSIDSIERNNKTKDYEESSLKGNHGTNQVGNKGDSNEETVLSSDFDECNEEHLQVYKSKEPLTSDMELVNLEDDEECDQQFKSDVIKEAKVSIMTHSKSDSDLSTEERRAEFYKIEANPVIEEHNAKADPNIFRNKLSLPTSESFNDFHYWREPMASLDIECPNAEIPNKEPQALKETEDEENDEIIVIQKENTEIDLDDEIDDQVVLASLTGINSRHILDEKKTETNSIDLEDLDDLDVIKDGEKLNALEIVDLSLGNALEEDGIKLMVEPLSESDSDINAKTFVDEELACAFNEQLEISSQRSELITETENLLPNVSEVSTAKIPPTITCEKSTKEGKFIIFSI